MSDFDLTIKVETMPSIEMNGYEELKKSVEELAEQMKNVEVTEENLQVSKKLVAEVRKRYTQLDQQRKDVEKQILEPVKVLKQQCAEVENIIKEGETLVRQQISTIEQQHKDERKAMLLAEFERLVDYYELVSEISFDKILESSWLNKSTSDKKAKQALQDKCKKVADDYALILNIVDEDDHVACVYKFTKNGFNVNDVLETWKQKQAQLAKLKEEIKEDVKKPDISIEPTQLVAQQDVFNSTLVVHGRSDVQKVVQFMLENNIKFKQI